MINTRNYFSGPDLERRRRMEPSIPVCRLPDAVCSDSEC